MTTDASSSSGPNTPVPSASFPGLSADAVAERRRAGLVNGSPSRGSRSVGSILAANIFTRFNAIISAMLAVVLTFGRLPDALFGGVMIVNAAIGIVQELRAKITLDRLRLIVTPTITVVRDGEASEIPVDEIVLGDVMILRQGDQIPADGEVLAADGLQVDESLVTGEADPIDRLPGDPVLSGSFVIAGNAYVRTTAVGEAAYARRLAAEAREFSLARSELRDGIDRILSFVTWLILPTAALLVWSQLQTGHGVPAAAVSTVAGVVGMVPQGLVLLVSMAFAVSVIRLGRRNALVQELPAVETLARVDLVAVDKTGTLTTGQMSVDAVEPIAVDPVELRSALAAIAATEPHPNPTLAAIRRAYPDDPGWTITGRVPFSSHRKYSAVEFAEHGVWILGAPSSVGAGLSEDRHRRVAYLASTGRRVLLVARAERLPDPSEPLDGVVPVAIVSILEEVRDDAEATIAYFLEQGVRVKVISGDDPGTVAAIAAKVGIPGAQRAVDARELPASGTPRYREAADRYVVFGRVVPEQKRDLVTAFQDAGHVVAMTGDGVNDVPSLKRADIGIAMGSGSPATRAVAQLILLDDRFASLPAVVAEGRRVIANMERVAKLFLAKTVYATLLAIAFGVAVLPFPLLPRHLTLIGTLSIGIPAFVLSFEPSKEPARSGFVGRVLRFAIPAGLVAGLVGFETFVIARSPFVGMSLESARSVTSITLLAVGLVILRELMEPLDVSRRRLLVALVVAAVAAVAVPPARRFFALEVPDLAGLAIVAVGALTSLVALHLAVIAVAWIADRWFPDRAGLEREVLRSG